MSIPHWRVPLDEPPEVLQLGRGRHGTVPVERYQLPGLWCLHLYSYSATLRVDGTPLAIRPGFASLVPPGAMMEYHFQGQATHLYAHFRLCAGAGSVLVPAMQDLGGRFDAVSGPLRSAIEHAGREPARLSAVIWSLLWQLADGSTRAGDLSGISQSSTTEPPAVTAARGWIEQHLSSRLRAADLARRVNLSHNHLTRLFRASVGLSIAGYIRQRRLAVARHLLLHTTLPIKAVAIQVGMSDLQQFNKYIRRGLGVSPSDLRRDGGKIA